MNHLFRLSATAVLSILIGVLVLGGQWISQQNTANLLSETIGLREIDKIKTIASLLGSMVEQIEGEAKATARMLASDHTVLEALQRNGLQRLNPMAQRLGEVFDLGEIQKLEVTDASETMLYLAQDPQLNGETGAGWGVSEVLTQGKGMLTSQRGTNSVLIQAIEPLKNGDQVIGALTAGVSLNQSLFSQLSRQLGAELVLLGRDGMIVNSLEQAEALIDMTGVNEAYMSKIPVFRVDAITHHTLVYLPIVIVDDAYVILARLDSNDAYRLLDAARERSMWLAMLTFFGSLVLGFIALRWLMRPLQKLRQRALQSALALTGEAIIETDQNEVRAVVKVLDTLTERLVQRNTELSHEKERAEAANRAKSQFLSNMSHEIRTPLNGVLGLTELLQHSPLDAEQKRYVGAIATAGKSLHSLLSDILDMAKIEEGQIQLERIDFDPRQVCQEIAQVYLEMASTRHIGFVTNLQTFTSDWVCADPTRLRQVLGNLLGNALKFTEQGQIEFSSQPIAAPEGDARNWCRFSISDTGIGMTAQVLAGLFQRFAQADASTTRRFGGSGLGLSICKHLIDVMGGHIHAESTPGQGSRFWFDLPLEAAQTKRPAAPIAPTPARATGSAQGMRVLVAEDNLINQMVICSLLEQRGASVTTADNGQLAFQALQCNTYDLIFMDCQMPVMDGFEATRQIRAWERTQNDRLPIPIVALTANVQISDREACFAAGMTDFTSKPIKGEVLDRIFQTYRA
jgi:signal transduction histidine kinase/ActR/RegA family two-component response regulator